MLGNPFFVMTNSFYSNGMRLANDCKDFFKSILSPSLEIEEKINYIFNNVYNIDLTSKYKVIHIRIGDECLVYNNYNLQHNRWCYYYDNILNLVNSNENENYILITDTKEFGIKLKESIPKLHYWDNNKIHLGISELYNQEQSIIDTLVDFFIMTKSSFIMNNGSGFSRLASEIFDVKYHVFLKKIK